MSISVEPVEPVERRRDGRVDTRALRLRPRAALLLAGASVLGLVAFGWPLVIQSHSSENLAHSADAPWIFVALLPLLLGIVVAEIAEGAIDAKAVAVLVLVVGRPVLKALRRVARRAAFGAPVTFARETLPENPQPVA